ncbi:glycerophosphodiester phosphodiesterase family protein [Laceyella putida]|uniref:Glycerophosphodiester phosphodiesterase family protein n=1 Tax=Laceyella putida TaxID=110101 RepID=A0ABW2RKR2_9BACL
MKRLFKRKRFWVILALLAFVYLNNSSLLVQPPDDKPWLMAHRGLGQTFHMEGLTNDTCTAERIYPPEHPYLENTLPSMRAAFAAGADMVELDVHITKDNQFAVFHDWTLDCRTNGTGVTRDHTLAELKKLDIGYGYTADGGKTFPFRGKGVGLMPSLDEVLSAFPDRSLLIHVKSNDPDEGTKLAQRLASLPADRLHLITVYGGNEPIAALEKQLPQLRTMSVDSMKACLLPYIAIGWTGIVPEACKHTQLQIPENVAPWLWGWPHRFLSRMDQVDTRTILVIDGGGFSSGFDTAEDLKRLPDGYSGGIWTNRIDRIAPLINRE